MIHSAKTESSFIAKSETITDFGLLISLGVQKQTEVWKEQNKKNEK